jgi:uncharacterized Tic20 family protein
LPGAPPPPRGNPNEERTMAMLCHITALSTFIVPLGHVLGPLIVWLIKREQYPMVDDHGRASLNFQISYTIYLLVLTLVFFVTFFALGLSAFPDRWDASTQPDPPFAEMATFFGAIIAFIVVSLAITIVWLVLVIVNGVAANNGRLRKYPLAIPFLRPPRRA